MKLKLKGQRCFETALRKMATTVLLKCGTNGGIAVYIPSETILKEMASKIV
jgi:hypothetical protein